MSDFKIKNERTVYEGFFSILKGVVHRKDRLGNAVEHEREMLERGDSVAVLVYEKDGQNFLLTRQFRYPTHKEDGYLLEIAAGGIEEGESAEDCAKRELLEELGYRVDALEAITHFYSTPGTSSERIFLYYAEVTSEDHVEAGGGDEREGEDIEVIRHPVSQLRELLATVKDAKTMIALQWYMLNKV